MSRAKTKRDSRPAAAQAKVKPEPKPKPKPETPTQPLLTPRRTAIALAVLFAVGVVVRLEHLNDVPVRTPDEKTYAAQAKRVLNFGWREFPVMVKEYNQDQRMALYPSPIRAGWVVLLAGAMNVTGVTDERAGSWLSCFLSVTTLALLGWMGHRFLPHWAALYGMLFLALSVPDLVIARRCWQDALMGTLGLLMVWCACEIKRDPGKRWHYALLVAAGSFSVLVKELGAFVYGGCVLYVLVFLFRQRAWRTIAALGIAGLAGAAVSVYVLTSAAGGVTPLLAAWRRLNEAVYSNPYCALYQGGPWYLSIWGFWILSPLNLVLWAFAAGLSLLPMDRFQSLSLPIKPLELSCFRLFSWMSVMLTATILILPNSQSFRFLAPIYGPMYLMGGMGAWAVVHLVGRKVDAVTRRVACGVVAAVVLYGAIAQYEQFVQAYVTKGIPDLSVKFVLDSRN